MSTLTKVFTVLLVVLSIVFTVMTVSVVAQTARWKDNADKYEQNARIADTNLRQMIAASSAEIASARDTIKSHLAKIGELESRMQADGAELARLRSDVARLKAEKSSAEAMNRGMLAQVEAARSGETEYRKQLADIEKRNIELERRNIDLNDRVNEQTAQIDVLFEQKRQYEQQINILRQDAEKLSRQARRPAAGVGLEEPAGAAMSNVTALTPGGPTAIRGNVVDVSDNLVTISVGSADGVKKDMIFVIHRNDQYVGDVMISDVTPSRAAGKLLRTTAPPAKGDQVTDHLAMHAPR